MTELDDLSTTAIHEAGHAVLYERLFCDEPTGRVTIKPQVRNDEEALGNHVGVEPFNGTETVSNDYAVYCCGGYAAMIAAGFSEEDAESGCTSDFKSALHWSSLPLSEVKIRAVHLLIKPENIAAVRRVADELLIRETLDGDVVQVLIEVSDGFATEADLERYLLMRSG